MSTLTERIGAATTALEQGVASVLAAVSSASDSASSAATSAGTASSAAEQTALDRIATDADRTAVAADKVEIEGFKNDAETAKIDTLAALGAASAATLDTQRLLDLRIDRAEQNAQWDVANLLRKFNAIVPSSAVAKVDYRGVATLNVEPSGDRTITIPAAEFITVSLTAIEEAVTLPLRWLTCMVIEAGTVPSGQIVIHYRYISDGLGGVAYPTQYAPAQTSPVAGVALRSLLNTIDGTTIRTSGRIVIQNTAATPVTIFFPIFAVGTQAELAAKVPPSNFRKKVEPVEVLGALPSRDFEFWHRWSADAADRQTLARDITLAADSVAGNNSNSGTRHAPKLTLATLSTASTDGMIGLKRGSRFKLQEVPVLTGIAGVSLRDFGRAGDPLPIIDAFEEVPNESWIAAGDGTYNFTPAATTSTTALVDDYYNGITVVEVDIAVEAAGKPYTARKQLMRKASLAECAATAGSYYIQSLGGGLFKRHIRPTDDSIPGVTFRYETINVYSPIWWYMSDDRSVSGVHIIGSCHGYGGISLGKGGVIDRCVQMHGPMHQSVIWGGLVQRTLFYKAAKDFVEGAACVFYGNDTSGMAGILRQVISLDVANVFYAHNSVGNSARWSQITVEDVMFINGRRTNGSLWGIALSAANTTKFVTTRAYVEGFRTGYSHVADLVYAEVTDSAFINVGFIYTSTLFTNNVVRLENISDPSDVNSRGCSVRRSSASSAIRNNLFHFRVTDRGVASDLAVSLLGTFTNTDTPVIERNLFVVDGPATSVLYGSLPTSGELSYTADNNVIVLVSPAVAISMNGGVSPVGRVGPPQGWDASDRYYGADTVIDRLQGREANTAFFDLSEDPRGIDAVFVDADNCDYRWADTDIARRIAKAVADRQAGPNWTMIGKPRIPTVEEAVQIIQNA
jgi:hypothetical protein